MFRVVPQAPLLAEAGLLALCPSLNSPVLNADGLPVGPARAAILVFAEEYGGLNVSVAVRSISTGDVQAFVYSGERGAFADVNQAMDTALTFAEGMGFLFDEDWVPQHGKPAALGLWCEITGMAGEPQGEQELELEELELSEESPLEYADEPAFEHQDQNQFDRELDLGQEREIELGDDPPLTLELDARPGGGEDALLLDDVAALELDQEVVDRPATARSETPPAPPTPAPTLTKFRRPPEKSTAARKPAPPAKDAANTGSELGRIALVRKRLGGGPEPAEKRSLLLRLLGQF